MTKFEQRSTFLLLLVGFLGSFYWFFPTYSADLMSVWLAGKFLSSGHAELVYAPIEEQFKMYAPMAWRDFMMSEYNYDGPVFPFLYPPLWAKVAQAVSGVNFWLLSAVALAVNAALQMATIGLALRACDLKRISPLLFVTLALIFAFGTDIGTQTLRQNQPQILVNFLLVLAVERARARDDLTAGISLALAASIKLYPAFFALFWLFSGNRRAFVSFLIAGMALALTSVLLTGWSLHAEFLHQLRVISRSALITPISFNLDATLSQLFFPEQIQRIPALEPPTEANPNPGWWGILKPPALRLISILAVLGSLAFLVRTYRLADHDTRHALVWPLAMTLMPLVLPLAWAYYFFPTAAFAGVLLDRLGKARGFAIWIVSLVLIFGPFLGIYRSEWLHQNSSALIYQWAGFTSFGLIFYGFWQATRLARTPSAA